MHQQGYIGRKMRIPKLQEKPAIIITAFGSTRKGKVALECIQQRFSEHLQGYEIFWAYTSEIIRKREGLPSLQESLAQVEAAGFRKAVVQPLHVFPGTEYQHVLETCSFFPGLRVLVGETLCHRWDFVREVLDVVSQDFLNPEEGLNLLALHGTPLAADPVNIVYMGIEQMVGDLYPNVMAAAIEGVPDHQAIMERIQRFKLAQHYKRVRIIPMMFLAGIHVEDDLMGEEESWGQALQEMGFSVECPSITHGEMTCYKGLAFRSACCDFFLDRVDRSLQLMAAY